MTELPGVTTWACQSWLRRFLGPGHQNRGVETPAFRPGRKRRFTSPEMSAVLASMFACPGTVCSPPPRRKRCCGITARTPGTCGTWPLSSTRTGTRAARARRDRGSSPPLTRETGSRGRASARCRRRSGALARTAAAAGVVSAGTLARNCVARFCGRHAIASRITTPRSTPGTVRRYQRPRPDGCARPEGSSARGPPDGPGPAAGPSSVLASGWRWGKSQGAARIRAPTTPSSPGWPPRSVRAASRKPLPG